MAAALAAPAAAKVQRWRRRMRPSCAGGLLLFQTHCSLLWLCMIHLNKEIAGGAGAVPQHADWSAAESRCRATAAALQRALKPQHADIVTRLYGLDGAPPQRQQAVAVSERVSKARIYQIKEVSVSPARSTQGFVKRVETAILQRWRAAGAAASRSETTSSKSSNAASVLAPHVPHSPCLARHNQMKVSSLGPHVASGPCGGCGSLAMHRSSGKLFERDRKTHVSQRAAGR